MTDADKLMCEACLRRPATRTFPHLPNPGWLKIRNQIRHEHGYPPQIEPDRDAVCLPCWERLLHGWEASSATVGP
jgi:hypothetical protein